jgi:hypothetical protein
LFHVKRGDKPLTNKPKEPEETFDKWGYKSGEEPRIFQVSGDGRLPSGWHDTPQPDKPAKAEADDEEPPHHAPAGRRGPRRNERVKDDDE